MNNTNTTTTQPQTQEARKLWPKPTAPRPTMEDLEEWYEEGSCEATDGCWTEPDGICEHGHPSWLLRLHMI